MRAGEAFNWQNLAPDTAGSLVGAGSSTAAGQHVFPLQGGCYQLAAIATWGGGSLTLQQLGPDGSTWAGVELTLDATGVVAANLSANGTAKVLLAPGEYRLIYVTGTALYATLVRIPTSE